MLLFPWLIVFVVTPVNDSDGLLINSNSYLINNPHNYQIFNQKCTLSRLLTSSDRALFIWQRFRCQYLVQNSPQVHWHNLRLFGVWIGLILLSCLLLITCRTCHQGQSHPCIHFFLAITKCWRFHLLITRILQIIWSHSLVVTSGWWKQLASTRTSGESFYQVVY